jgi:hypothetical protein
VFGKKGWSKGQPFFMSVYYLCGYSAQMVKVNRDVPVMFIWQQQQRLPVPVKFPWQQQLR